MNHPVRTTFLTLAVLCTAASAQAAGKSNDEAMLSLAKGAGCMTCHHIDPGAKGPEGLPPIGPAWRDVAAKYKGDKTAPTKLTQIVLKGSNPYESHWKGKASGLAMPPNAVAIQEADAKKLVDWILKLQPK
ncbi:MAG: c-type cytochrome [Burkholderiaceae bacterium]|nr:c-type cytochrome [Burkholderiaceae bacterium]